MKLISFTVPCYNSREYMEKCVDSLLTGGDDVEIIIVNDGSSDDTLDIANAYAERFPDIVKVIDKENGGHGSGVNAGMRAATGLYFKVVDSDDWLDAAALNDLIEVIKQHKADNTLPDLYITNFVYDKVSADQKYVSSYENMMPTREIIGWDRVEKFAYSHMLLMHSLMYKRDRLLESGTVLPEHTFYVDNIFAYKPLPYMKTLCYVDVDLYHYFIGRDDQSVNKSNFIKRYDQQLRVMKCMIDAYSYKDLKKMDKHLRRYMWHAMFVILVNTVFFICAEKSKERKAALKELWRYMKKTDRKMFNKLRYRSYVSLVNFLPWGLRSFIMNKSYDYLCKKINIG